MANQRFTTGAAPAGAEVAPYPTIGHGQAWRVSLRDVPRELKKAIAGQAPPASEDDHPPARARVLNLVVYAEGEATARMATQTIADLSGHHPSLTIVLIGETDQPDEPIEAWVTAHCHRRDGGYQVICHEEVLLRAGGSIVRDLPSAAETLAISHLPTVLWLAADFPRDPEVLDQLLEESDRVIIDSAGFVDPIHGLRRAAVIPSDELDAPHLLDLNFARLTPWRLLISQFFDPAELRPYVNEITSVNVTLDSAARVNWVQGWFVAGWLASRLGWRLEGPPTRGRVTFRHGKREVDVRFQVGGPFPGGNGGLGRVELKTSGSLPPATFTVERAVDDVCAQTAIAIDGQPCRSRVVHLTGPQTLSELLISELTMLGREHVFEQSLAVAVTIAQ